MKKIILPLMLLCSIFLFGCGNKQIIDTEYKFSKATIIIGGVSKEVKIKKWNDYNDSTVQIIDTDGNVYLTSYTNVVLQN